MVGELVILYSTIINYLLLSFTKNVTGIYVAKKRLWLSALLSAMIATFIPSFFMSSLLSFIVLIGCAFSFKISSFKAQGSWVIIATLLVGGLLTALQSIMVEATLSSYFVLTFFIGFLSLIFVRKGWQLKVLETIKQSYERTCEIELFEQQLIVTAYIDTGNECVEPISRKPVHFISYPAVESYLPKAIKEALLQWQQHTPSNLSLFESTIRRNIRFISLNTVQGNSGIVPAFRVNKLIIADQVFENHYVVFTKNDASFPQNADMILHASILMTK